jgi:phosphoglycolate phosphatase
LTRLVLDGLGIADHFVSVVAASPALPPKPAPHMLLAALAGARARPERAVMVGDSATDAATARAAGVSCVLLRHGYSSVPVDSLGAEAVADDIRGLRSVLCTPGNG